MDAAFLGAPVVIWIGGALALYMAWAIGANDVANAMGTSVGSGALRIWQAVVVAGLLEFSGAFLAGGHVTDTVRKGILDVGMLDPPFLVCGMLGSLASAATLLLLATRMGLPVSTTHAIVGAIVGFGAVGVGLEAVAWVKVAQIVGSWITSPLLGGVLGFLSFRLIRRLILDSSDPVEAGRRWGPAFFFVVTFVMSLVTVFKGFKNLNLHLDLPAALAWSASIGALGALLGRVFLQRVRVREGDRSLRSVERVFSVLQVLAACAVAFAHGSNDVANAIGPLAAVVNVARGAAMAGKAPLEPWMLMVGGIGIVFGLGTWGYRVMETVGRRITELTPSRGFAATIAATLTIVLASRLGIPVSTTHILVGSVLGVGLARGIGALNLGVLGRIVVSWIATLPLAALLSVFFLYFFKGLLTPW